MRLFSTILFVVFGSVLYSQIPQNIDSIKINYEDENYVILQNDLVACIDLIKDEIIISEEKSSSVLLLTDRAAAYSSKKISVSSLDSLIYIKANSLNYNNGKYKKATVKYIDKTKAISNEFFYDGMTDYSFNYLNLNQYSITNLYYKTTNNNPYFGTGYFFGGYSPHLSEKFTLKVNNHVDVEFHSFNLNDSLISYNSYTKGNFTYHIWKTNLPVVFEHEPYAPSLNYNMPQVLVKIKSYTIKDSTFKVLGDVKDLFNWYNNLLSSMDRTYNQKLDDEVHLLTDSIIDEEDKVKAVFKWVQKNVKYIAVEDGLGGFIPRNPVDVYTKRYGDCKDMACVIVEMLSYIDIKAYPVWIGTRKIPFRYSELPTPNVDNHMIAAYYSNEKSNYVFLDATNSYVPYGLPSSFIQGKEALIRISDSTFIVENVPEVKKDNTIWKENFVFSIDSNLKLSAIGEESYTGYYFVNEKYNLSDISSKEEFDEYIYRSAKKGNKKFFIDDYSINKNNDNVIYNYSFNIDDYITRNDNDLYLNMNFRKVLKSKQLLELDRKYNVENKFNSLIDLTYSLNIPKGYKVDFIPEKETFIHEKFDYSISYEIVDSQIIYHFILNTKYLTLEKSDFEQYNNFLTSLKKSYKESIILTKK